MKNIISSIASSPAVKNFAASALKTAQKAAKAIKAGMDSWNTTEEFPKELSKKDQLARTIRNLADEKSIQGTLTQRTAEALVLADEYVSELRTMRVWGYLTEAKAVECLTTTNLRDIAQVIRHCEVDLTAQETKAKNEQLCKELLAMATQKDGMRLADAVAFGQPAAEEILLRRFRAENAKNN